MPNSLTDGPGAFAECGVCPFSLLCIMGRFHNGHTYFNADRMGDKQVFLCPACGCVGRETGLMLRKKCPGRVLKGAWKGGWKSKFTQECKRSWDAKRCIDYEALTTAISVDDPLYPGQRLFIYLCEFCFQDPPSTKLEVSIYDLEAGPP